MYNNIPSFQKLIRQLQKVPYLASRNVYRVALFFLNSSDSVVDGFCKTILETRKSINFCSDCFNLSENDPLCIICKNQKRNHDIICVVESWHDLVAIENLGDYCGLYHILGGSLCPLEGIGPENLRIEELLQRLKKNNFKELIFATSSTPEGEATASYIFSKLPKENTISVTKLASGMPTGSTLAFMDRITIAKSLLGRRPF